MSHYELIIEILVVDIKIINFGVRARGNLGHSHDYISKIINLLVSHYELII